MPQPSEIMKQEKKLIALMQLERELVAVRQVGSYIRELITRLQIDQQHNTKQESNILNRIENLESV